MSKKFNFPEVTRATEDYLKAIWSELEQGVSPSTVGLSRRLGLAASTVSEAIKKLTEQKLLCHNPYGSIDLTEQGRKIAVSVVRNHRIIETYLCKQLGYSWEEVHEEAEILEHVASARLIEAMYEQLGCPQYDPHGDPIPSADGVLPSLETVSLSAVEAGRRIKIARISDDDSQLLQYLEEQEVLPQSEAVVLKVYAAGGLMYLQLGNREVVLGLSAAEQIEVIVLE